jgi:NTE family protein
MGVRLCRPIIGIHDGATRGDNDAMRKPAIRSVDLALQGGGSHGAFTWGVLDRLLEDGRLRFDGVSGTSAGALNAGVLATGWARGGADGAREALRAFWLDVSDHGTCFGAAGLALPGAGIAGYNLDANPLYAWMNQWLKLFSPTQFNPLGVNALRDVARRHVSDDAMRRGPLKIFVTATAVTTGQPEVFMGERLSLDALLASACLPQLFKAVEIDGVPYWDGGYSGNPAIWPLIYHTDATDVLLVKINPLVRPGVPDTTLEIADRVNEITYNAGLVGELRAIHFVQELLKAQRIDKRRYKNLRLHMIADEEGLAPLQQSSKLNTDRNFLLALHELGRLAAQAWLEKAARKVGRESSLDIKKTFLDKR